MRTMNALPAGQVGPGPQVLRAAVSADRPSPQGFCLQYIEKFVAAYNKS
jgi:hypothetical protein